eukprot:scaffold47910_cov51-Phaeocystis_antarctica.AAC.1
MVCSLSRPEGGGGKQAPACARPVPCKAVRVWGGSTTSELAIVHFGSVGRLWGLLSALKPPRRVLDSTHLWGPRQPHTTLLYGRPCGTHGRGKQGEGTETGHGGECKAAGRAGACYKGLCEEARVAADA